jgi:hypothetical protein
MENAWKKPAKHPMKSNLSRLTEAWQQAGIAAFELKV